MASSTSTPTTGKVVQLHKPKKGSTKKVKQQIEESRNKKVQYKTGEKRKPLTLSQVRGWEPTPEQRYAVRCMSATGVKQDVIARAIHPLGPISVTTLRRYFRDELDNGKALLLRDVVAVATQMALSGDCPSMTKFWLQVHGGWKEPSGAYGQHTQKFGTQSDATEDIMKRLQNSAKYMAETLPGVPETPTGTD